MRINIYKLVLLDAVSLVSIRDLRRWLVDGVLVELPYTWSRGSKTFRCAETIDVVEDRELSTYLWLDASTEGVVYLDSTPHHIYMHSLREIPLKPGFRELSIEFLDRDAQGIGARVEKPEFRRAMLVTRSRTLWKLSTLLKTLVELWRVSSDSSLRRDIEKLISRALSIVRIECVDPTRLGIVVRELANYDYLQHYIYRRVLEEVSPNILVFAGCREPDMDSVVESAKHALDYVEREVEELVSRYGKRGTLHAVATTHLDFLWLWSIDVFEKKLLGSIATLLHYVERVPNAVAGFTALHYVDEVSRLSPQLFERLRKCFDDGKCVALGGFWTEFDANLIDGESMARQLLYGQRALKKVWGRVARIGFLPDTFGFPPSMPQILLKSGIELFVIRKLSWNDTNRFPYKHFLWIGIDGSAIPTIFVEHYAASLPVDVGSVAKVMQDVDSSVDRVLYPYGYGDGGGGPPEEASIKLEAISKLPTLPRVVHGDLDTLIASMKSAVDRLPTWFGELYLENHRGVYSAGLKLKKLVKSCVKVLKAIDALLVLALLRGVELSDVRKRVRDLWLRVLAYQFHDVIASTLSFDAYIDAMKALGKTYREALELARETLSRVVKALGLRSGIAILNPHPWRYRTLLEIEIPKDAECVELDSSVLPCQLVEDLGDRKRVLVDIELPPLGIVVLRPVKTRRDVVSDLHAECDDSTCVLENRYLRVVVDRVSGFITSIIDKELGIEVLSKSSNVLEVCVDRPSQWDGWNIDPSYRENCVVLDRAESVELRFTGPLRACIEVVKRFRNSEIVQRLCLDRESRILVIRTDVRWFERQYLVKAWFYPDVHSYDAWFETSFGAFPRPRHRNTSWEQAKFEVWMYRWVDVSEKRFGFTLISLDSHGVSLDLKSIGLTLFRSPLAPSPQDIGRNSINYAIYIHRGDWRDARVQHRVREVDERPLVVKVDGDSDGVSVVGIPIDVGDAVVEAVKLCEDIDRCILFRVFDGYGDRLWIDFTQLAGDGRCVEMDIAELSYVDTQCRVSLRPFEVKNIAIVYQQRS